MFEFDIEEHLKKKLVKIRKKDKVLALIFKKKVLEIINCNLETISTYKNLKTPLNNFKRIHLTDNYILLFKVEYNQNKVIFIDIRHRDFAYKVN